jgi:hypothetical protein
MASLSAGSPLKHLVRLCEQAWRDLLAVEALQRDPERQEHCGLGAAPFLIDIEEMRGLPACVATEAFVSASDMTRSHHSQVTEQHFSASRLFEFIALLERAASCEWPAATVDDLVPAAGRTGE